MGGIVFAHKRGAIPLTVLHYVNFATKKQHRPPCCSPSDHTTQCAVLYIANCSYDTCNATILGDVLAELAKRNNLRTTTQHNARYCILQIAAMTHTMQQYSVMQQRNLQTQQPTPALFERGGKDRRSRSRPRSWRSRLKIEIDAEFPRSSIQTIEVKIDLCEGDLDLDLQHCFPITSITVVNHYYTWYNSNPTAVVVLRMRMYMYGR